MKSTQYSEKVLEHFRNPRNVGTLEGEGVSVGKVGNPVCGDLMEIYIKVEEDKIEDIKLRTFGCGSAIATVSMISELAKGKTLEEAKRITRQDVASELDGLPPVKMHCSNLASDALRDAIDNYESNQKKTKQPEVKQGEENSNIEGQDKFMGRGVFKEVNDVSLFKDRRVMVADRGDESIKLALQLATITPRVVFISTAKEIQASPALRSQLKKSDVKVLLESEVVEVKGFKDVEQVKVHDLNEGDRYDLFIDSLVLL